jgi:hypothetical protein
MKSDRDRVVYVDKEHLEKYNLIENVFYYEDFELDDRTKNIYKYFENEFTESYSSLADVFNIEEYSFFIKDSCKCNAFARHEKGYNIIGITNSYPILLSKKFDSKYFKNLILNLSINKENISLAYVDLFNNEKFDFGKFMLDSSMKFTMGHEFRHIKQFNSIKIRKESFYLQENMIQSDFKIKNHAWEFDADRGGCYDVLKYVFRVDRNLKERSDDKFKCLLYAGCASMMITKYLFYYGLIYQDITNITVKKVEFYIKKNSHPHPLTRCMNILDYYYSNIVDDFPKLDMDYQEYFTNVFGILKLYFDALLGDKNFIKQIFDDLETHMDDINKYNDELYDIAIQDEAIRNLLISSNIKVDGFQ